MGEKNKFSQRNKDDTLFMHLYEEFFLDHLHSVAGLARISVEHTQTVSSSIGIVILQCNGIVTVVINIARGTTDPWVETITGGTL